MKALIVLSTIAVFAAPASYGRELNESFLLRAEARAQESAETKLVSQDKERCDDCSECDEECGTECNKCDNHC